MRSFASRNQLAADPRDRAGQALEWDRHYVTVLGVANQRLYSFRLQTASDTYERAQACRPGCLRRVITMSMLLLPSSRLHIMLLDHLPYLKHACCAAGCFLQQRCGDIGVCEPGLTLGYVSQG